MAKKPGDKRSRRTRQRVIGSFNELALSSPFKPVNVSEILRKAEVARSTFYEHFRGQDDVLLEASLHRLSAMADLVLPRPPAGAIEDLLIHFWENQQMARTFLGPPTGELLCGRLADLIRERLENETPLGRQSVPARLVAVQVAGAQFAAIRAWLHGELRCTSKELAAALTAAARGTVAAAFAGKPASR